MTINIKRIITPFTSIKINNDENHSIFLRKAEVYFVNNIWLLWKDWVFGGA